MRDHRRTRARRRTPANAALLAACAAAATAAACASGRYEPYPLALDGALPDDAFARCRVVLLRGYGALAVEDAHAFRLQTAWAALGDPPGERRATVYRERVGDRDELAIVVELRRLTVPLLGLPEWAEPRGDDAAERALAEQLRSALEAPAAAAR